MALTLKNGRVVCGRKARVGGICVDCLHKHDRLAETRHSGQCEKCGGLVVCGSGPMKNGSGVCRMHGGNQKKGAQSHSYRGKGLSKYLPPQIADRFEEMRNDPELLSLRDEVSLLRTRMTQLTERLYSGESGGIWSSLLGHKANFDAAQRRAAEAVRRSDSDEINEAKRDAAAAMSLLLKTIDDGEKYERDWAELATFVNQVAITKRMATASMKDQQQMITAEEAVLLIGQLTRAVLDEEPCPIIRGRIIEKFNALTHRGSNVQNPPMRVVDAVDVTVVAERPLPAAGRAAELESE